MAHHTQPPSSPTSLLWAHQMKREHGFLLTRMQKLEAAISRIEAIAIATQKKGSDVAEATQKVQTLVEETRNLNNNKTEMAIQRLRKDVSEQFEELDERLEAIIEKLDSVDRAADHAANNMKRTSDREAEILERVKGLEEGMKNFQDNMRLLGRKVDDGSVEQVQAQVQKLMQRAQDAGDDHEQVQETVAMLEAAVEAMKFENKNLESQVQTAREEMGARAAEAAMSVRALQAAQEALLISAPHGPAQTQAQSHVAGQTTTEGTNADDAPTVAGLTVGEVAASNCRKDKATSQKTESKAGPSKKSTRSNKKVHGTNNEPAPPPTHDVTAARASGEAAPKPMSMKRELAGLQTETSSKRRKIRLAHATGPEDLKKSSTATQQVQQGVSSDVASEGTIRDKKTQMPIVRKGKGWVEVVEPLDDSDTEDLAELARLVPPSNTTAGPLRTASIDFAGNPIKSKNEHGHLRKAAMPALEESQTRAQPTKRRPRRPRKQAAKPSVQASSQQPNPPAPERRTIDQKETTQARPPARGKKRKADEDIINETIALSAPRATRSQRGVQAPAPGLAKRGSRDVVDDLVTVETNARVVTPEPAKKCRRGLTGIFSSPISSTPGSSDLAKDMGELKPATSSTKLSKNPPPGRKRTIPQNGSVPVVHKDSEQVAAAQLTEAVFDKDFEM